MARFSFFIYRFNGPVMTQMFRQPATPGSWTGCDLMLAGIVRCRVLGACAVQACYAIVGLRDWRRWRTEHARLAGALEFTGGNTPLDKA
jgi:hypothetical protein